MRNIWSSIPYKLSRSKTTFIAQPAKDSVSENGRKQGTQQVSGATSPLDKTWELAGQLFLAPTTTTRGSDFSKSPHRLTKAMEKKGSSKALTYQTHPKSKKDFQLTGKITKARGKGPSRHNTVNCNKCSNMHSKQKSCKSLHGQRRTKRNVMQNQEGCTDCRQADHQGLFRLPFRTTTTSHFNQATRRKKP